MGIAYGPLALFYEGRLSSAMMTNQRNAFTVVSYPERGEGGNKKYRGNCSPKLIKDLIAHFGVQEICDYMCGSNTTGDAARTMGI